MCQAERAIEPRVFRPALSAATERGGEGVFIPEPQKLAVTGQITHLSELLIHHPNFRYGEKQISREPFAGNYTEVPKGIRTSDLTSELSTNSKTASREHFVGTNSELPMPVGTSDAMKEVPIRTNFC